MVIPAETKAPTETIAVGMWVHIIADCYPNLIAGDERRINFNGHTGMVYGYDVPFRREGDRWKENPLSTFPLEIEVQDHPEYKYLKAFAWEVAVIGPASHKEIYGKPEEARLEEEE